MWTQEYGVKTKNHRPPGLTWDCPDPGLNRGPLDLQSNALPTELSGPVMGIPYIILLKSTQT